MTDLSFRIAQLDDAPHIVRLINAAMRPEPGKGGWTSESNFVGGERTHLEEVQEIIKKKSNIYMLGLHNDKIVACIHVDGSTRGEAYLGTMSVEPTLQNSGIAKTLGAHTNEYATTAMGARFFVILILAPRLELLALSYKRGYEQTGRAFPYRVSTKVGIPKRDNLAMLELHKISNFRVKRTLKILFSRNPALEEKISKRLQDTEHHITFANFNTDNISQFDLVVPLTLNDLKYTSQNQHLLLDNGLPMPNIELIHLLEDKLQLNKTLISKGYGRHIPKIKGPLPFPYLLKKRLDEHNAHTHLISNPQDELRFSETLEKPDYFVQVLVPAKEHFSTYILFQNKKIIRSRTIKNTYDTEISVEGKNKIIHTEETACQNLILLRTLLNSLNFEGLCSINYTLFKNHIYILGINPIIDDGFINVLPPFIDVIA